MKYDFTSMVDRRSKDAIAVDTLGNSPGFAPDKPKEGFDPIPMWVADMNFPVVPSITEAIAERVKHPAFGYFFPRDEYFDAIIRWQETRNGVTGLENNGYHIVHSPLVQDENNVYRMDFEDMEKKIVEHNIHAG